VFAHFFDAGNFQHLALEGKDQSVETGDIDSVLPCAIPFQWMASQHGQFHQFLDISDLLDRVDT
jgi:hypothetical protein